MGREFDKDLEKNLKNVEYAKAFGAARAKSELAVTLAGARRIAGLSQEELANRLGSSQPYIAKLEGGDANPTMGNVGALLAVLGMRLSMSVVPLQVGTYREIVQTPQTTTTIASYDVWVAKPELSVNVWNSAKESPRVFAGVP